MTARRRALPELSAYRERARTPFPWHAVRWQHVYFGAYLGALIAAFIALGLWAWLR